MTVLGEQVSRSASEQGRVTVLGERMSQSAPEQIAEQEPQQVQEQWFQTAPRGRVSEVGLEQRVNPPEQMDELARQKPVGPPAVADTSAE